MPYKQGHEEGLAETREMTMKYNMEILGSIPVIHLALRVLKTATSLCFHEHVQ